MLLTPSSSLIDPDTARNLIAFSSLVVAVMAIVLPVISFRNRNDIKAVRYQVENNHRDSAGNPVNLREEQDERHSENAGRLENMAKTLTGVLGELGTIRDDIRALRQHDADADEKIADLEKTRPKTAPTRRRKP